MSTWGLLTSALAVVSFLNLNAEEPTYARAWHSDTVGSPKMSDLYDLTDEILGQGGYGIVRKGVAKDTGEFVAIKEMSKQETSARDFWAEVDLLRVAGKHPNIMSLKGAYETKDLWYIVQEMATGGELFDTLVQNGAYSEKEASDTVSLSNMFDI